MGGGGRGGGGNGRRGEGGGGAMEPECTSGRSCSLAPLAGAQHGSQRCSCKKRKHMNMPANL